MLLAQARPTMINHHTSLLGELGDLRSVCQLMSKLFIIPSLGRLYTLDPGPEDQGSKDPRTRGPEDQGLEDPES